MEHLRNEIAVLKMVEHDNNFDKNSLETLLSQAELF